MQVGPLVGVRPVYPTPINLTVVSGVFRRGNVCDFFVHTFGGFVRFYARLNDFLGFFRPLFVFRIPEPIEYPFANFYNGVKKSRNLRSLLGWVTPTTVSSGGGSSYY